MGRGIFNCKSGEFIRYDQLMPDDYEMLGIAEKEN